MADVAATNPGMDRYNRYYTEVLKQLQADQGPERSDSQLKNYLMRMIRPTYDQAIAQRQQQTGQANAMIDTDAAGRGMGTSTWVTDAKNRQRNNEAQDIANLNSNYNSTLYDSLLGLINQRDQNRLALMGQAQSIAGSMYDRWKEEDDALAAQAAGGGGGGGGAGGGGGGSRRMSTTPGNTLPTGFGDDLLTGNENKTPTPTTGGNQSNSLTANSLWAPATPVAGTASVGATRNLNDDKIDAGKTSTWKPATTVAGTSSVGATRSLNDDKIDAGKKKSLVNNLPKYGTR